MIVAGHWLAVRISYHSPALSDPAALKRRVVFDAVGILAGTFIGYRWLVAFILTEGLATVRMHTELSLAHGIQATLVPTISFRTARFEVYGKSLPSTEMGGDLIDTIESDGSLLAYVADVSGHGLAAGQLMGMLKTAIRVSRQLGQPPVATLEQFPLGLLPGGRYSSQRVTYVAGDVFLMLTDGISEVPNAEDEDFGLRRLEQLLVHNAARPLQQLCEIIMHEVKHHGAQQDDQTLLLLRVLL